MFNNALQPHVKRSSYISNCFLYTDGNLNNSIILYTVLKKKKLNYTRSYDLNVVII